MLLLSLVLPLLAQDTCYSPQYLNPNGEYFLAIDNTYSKETTESRYSGATYGPGAWFRLDLAVATKREYIVLSTCSSYTVADTFIAMYKARTECYDGYCNDYEDCRSSQGLPQSGQPYLTWLTDAHSTSFFNSNEGNTYKCPFNAESATLVLPVGPNAETYYMYIGTEGSKLFGNVAVRMEEFPSLDTMVEKMGWSQESFCPSFSSEECLGFGECRRVQYLSASGSTNEHTCVARDRTKFSTPLYCNSGDFTSKDACQSGTGHYCTWNTFLSRCEYNPPTCGRDPDLSNWCEDIPEGVVPLCYTPCISESQPDVNSECQSWTGFNPELRTVLANACDSDALGCGANEHCGYISMGLGKAPEPTCVCNNDELMHREQFDPNVGCDAPGVGDKFDGVRSLIQGTFTGSLPTKLDVRCGIPDHQLYLDGAVNAWNGRTGCVGSCLEDTVDLPISITFLPHGGIAISVLPNSDYVPPSDTDYDGTAMLFSPSLGGSFTGRLTNPDEYAPETFNDGRVVMLTYNVRPLTSSMYEVDSEEVILSEDPCFRHGNRAECEGVVGCSFCHSVGICHSIEEVRFASSEHHDFSLRRWLNGLQCDTPVEGCPGVQDSPWLSRRETDEYPSSEFALRLLVQKVPGKTQSVKIAVGTSRPKFVSGWSGTMWLESDAVWNHNTWDAELPMSTAECTGPFIPLSLREAPSRVKRHHSDSDSTTGFTNSMVSYNRDVKTFSSAVLSCVDAGGCVVGSSEDTPGTNPTNGGTWSDPGSVGTNGGNYGEPGTEFGDWPPECDECPCTDASFDAVCRTSDGARSFGEEGCFDAACGDYDDFCGRTIDVTSSNSVYYPRLRFCDGGTHLQSCNLFPPQDGFYSTSRFANDNGFLCADSHISDQCKTIDSHTGHRPEGLPSEQPDAFCVNTEVVEVSRAVVGLPLHGVNPDKDVSQYVRFEAMPWQGIIVPSECIDMSCVSEGNPARQCVKNEEVELDVAVFFVEDQDYYGTGDNTGDVRQPTNPDAVGDAYQNDEGSDGAPDLTDAGKIDCNYGVFPSPFVQYVGDTERLWLFVVDAAVEDFSEYVVYELNGVHYGLEVAVAGEVDEEASLDLSAVVANGDAGTDDDTGLAKSTGGGDEGDIMDIVPFVAIALVVCCLVLIVQQVRSNRAKQASRSRATRGEPPMGANPAGSGTMGAMQMRTMNTMGGMAVTSATMELGEVVNMRDKSNLIDAKYIIKPDDLVKSKKIGEGGYGYVYAGEWRDMEVAIKEVRGTDPAVVEMLMLEARAAIDLRPHQNIVTLYGVCLEPFSIVTAFCAKGSLDDMLYGSNPVSFDDAEVKNLCVGIASGISHLHHEGIIHRDLAARNILVNEMGTPMVADFGMSRKDENALEGTENQTKTTVGPIRWMAPEQLDAQMYSAASDTWSFGVILYEIFAREVPWKKYSNMKAAQLVLNEHHLAEEKYRPEGLNACVLKVMKGCFEYESGDRPKMSWCVKKLSKDWAAPSGGAGWTGGAKKDKPAPAESEGFYSAPPTRAVASKKSGNKGTSDAGTLAQSSRSKMRRSSSERRKRQSSGKRAASPTKDTYSEPPSDPTAVARAYGEPPAETPFGTDVAADGSDDFDIAEGLYEAPKKR